MSNVKVVMKLSHFKDAKVAVKVTKLRVIKVYLMS